MQRKWASNLKSAGGVGADERERGDSANFPKTLTPQTHRKKCFT